MDEFTLWCNRGFGINPRTQPENWEIFNTEFKIKWGVSFEQRGIILQQQKANEEQKLLEIRMKTLEEKYHQLSTIKLQIKTLQTTLAPIIVLRDYYVHKASPKLGKINSKLGEYNMLITTRKRLSEEISMLKLQTGLTRQIFGNKDIFKLIMNWLLPPTNFSPSRICKQFYLAYQPYMRVRNSRSYFKVNNPELVTKLFLAQTVCDQRHIVNWANFAFEYNQDLVLTHLAFIIKENELIVPGTLHTPGEQILFFLVRLNGYVSGGSVMGLADKVLAFFTRHQDLVNSNIKSIIFTMDLITDQQLVIFHQLNILQYSYARLSLAQWEYLLDNTDINCLAVQTYITAPGKELLTKLYNRCNALSSALGKEVRVSNKEWIVGWYELGLLH